MFEIGNLENLLFMIINCICWNIQIICFFLWIQNIFSQIKYKKWINQTHCELVRIHYLRIHYLINIYQTILVYRHRMVNLFFCSPFYGFFFHILNIRKSYLTPLTIIYVFIKTKVDKFSQIFFQETVKQR